MKITRVSEKEINIDMEEVLMGIQTKLENYIPDCAEDVIIDYFDGDSDDWNWFMQTHYNNILDDIMKKIEINVIFDKNNK